ncbi:MAG TPA: hypothetical protein VM821_07390, partial [Abditibacteriaceae bacterium]|nr:hypothetical protein [Abditibacteriaceae bacterium]
MTDKEIVQLAAELNAETLKSNCVVKFVQHGGGPDESHVVATRTGYLKLASLFLHAAVAPHEDESLVVD